MYIVSKYYYCSSTPAVILQQRNDIRILLLQLHAVLAYDIMFMYYIIIVVFGEEFVDNIMKRFVRKTMYIVKKHLDPHSPLQYSTIQYEYS